MTKSRLIYERERVPEHTQQFRASVMVLQYLSRYATLKLHRERVLLILNGGKNV